MNFSTPSHNLQVLRETGIDFTNYVSIGRIGHMTWIASLVPAGPDLLSSTSSATGPRLDRTNR